MRLLLPPGGVRISAGQSGGLGSRLQMPPRAMHDAARMDLRAPARLASCAVIAAVLLVSPAARACSDEARSWAERCSAIEGVVVAPEYCMPDKLVVVATARGGCGAAGAPLHVEINRDASRGFVHAGEFGASPVGDFADWSAEPASTRRAFDAVVACATPGIPEAAFVPVPDPARVSWALVGAVLALPALCVAALRLKPRVSDRLLHTRWFELGIIALYIGLAVHLGEHYPLSPLEMFAELPPGVGNLGVVDPRGTLVPVTEYVDWNCKNGLAAPLDGLPDACMPDRGAGIIEKRLDYMRGHASDAAVGEPLALTRRVWIATATGPLKYHDCFVDACTARRVSR